MAHTNKIQMSIAELDEVLAILEDAAEDDRKWRKINNRVKFRIERARDLLELLKTGEPEVEKPVRKSKVVDLAARFEEEIGSKGRRIPGVEAGSAGEEAGAGGRLVLGAVGQSAGQG